ncbi:uncharacterized protein LOC126898859 [Daktulosphaira vitifoliae]|uniref:uncharacterized protein LOC126898859 n=1 Tax=Daktulosphaira vitifoliae TaxID=58002 RepID=UPI0021AA834F|nr:uncharacterized protein LOC126898859 [Daktulosphaira vitifoliae]
MAYVVLWNLIIFTLLIVCFSCANLDSVSKKLDAQSKTRIDIFVKTIRQLQRCYLWSKTLPYKEQLDYLVTLQRKIIFDVNIESDDFYLKRRKSPIERNPKKFKCSVSPKYYGFYFGSPAIVGLCFLGCVTCVTIFYWRTRCNEHDQIFY